jgi:hypothetical protein
MERVIIIMPFKYYCSLVENTRMLLFQVNVAYFIPFMPLFFIMTIISKTK